MDRGQVSARGADRIIRMSWTLADLAWEALAAAGGDRRGAGPLARRGAMSTDTAVTIRASRAPGYRTRVRVCACRGGGERRHSGVARCSAIELPPSTIRYSPVT